MKTTQKLICMLAVLCSTATFAQEKKEMPSEMEKAWMEYMTPGKTHKELASAEGMWTEDLVMWMTPDAPPMKNTATVINKMIMGGRYQQGTHRGTFDGMPFEGMSIVGFDNAKQSYVSTWIDNMGTGLMYMEGKWNEDLKGVEFKGMSVDPMTGKDMPVREIYRVESPDKHMLEMYMTTAEGKEYKSMEITMMRKKMSNPAPIKDAPVKPSPTKNPPPKQPADQKK
jgi:hypothetical protein